MASRGRASLDDLVDATGFQPSVIQDLAQLAPGATSLDEVVGDGLATLGELQIDDRAPGPEDLALDRSTADDVQILLGCLTGREADVIRMRFGVGGDEPLTLEEVGGIFGVTRERIRQIGAKALKKLRRHLGVSVDENRSRAQACAEATERVERLTRAI
jgi:RNA polymerase primary sigma factor